MLPVFGTIPDLNFETKFGKLIQVEPDSNRFVCEHHEVPSYFDGPVPPGTSRDVATMSFSFPSCTVTVVIISFIAHCMQMLTLSGFVGTGSTLLSDCAAVDTVTLHVAIL